MTAWEVTAAPTCTEDGLRERHCENCDLSESEALSAAGHSWGEWETALEATCTEDGKQIRTCGSCGETESVTITAKGHDWSDWTLDRAATCTEEGRMIRTCANGGETEFLTTEAIGHKWSDWTVVRAATTEAEGLSQRTCANCGEIQTQTIAKLAAHVHNWSAWTVDTAATCTTDGKNVRTCTACGEKEYETVSATGHSWGEWSTAKEASCTAEGQSVRTCANCSSKEYFIIPPTGHKWSEWTTVRPATVTEAGERQCTCENCSEIRKEEIPVLNSYKITVSAGAGGTVSPGGVTLAEANSTLTVSVTPNDGFEIETITIDGKDAEKSGSYTFYNITEDHSLNVTFREKPIVLPRSCIAISVTANRDIFLSDRTAFEPADFTIAATISDNGEVTRTDISADCSAAASPDAFKTAQRNADGTFTLSFRYSGTDADIAAFAAANSITVPVLLADRGDVDANSEVNLDDAISTLKHYTSGILGHQEEISRQTSAAMDVDESGDITLEDAICILQYYSAKLRKQTPDWNTILKH